MYELSDSIFTSDSIPKPKVQPQRTACDICHKWFSTKPSMLRHRLIHSDTRPFTCSTCGRGFNQAYAMKQHKCLHQEPKPKPRCETCGNLFASPEYLAQHKLHYCSRRPGELEVSASSAGRNSPSMDIAQNADIKNDPDPQINATVIQSNDHVQDRSSQENETPALVPQGDEDIKISSQDVASSIKDSMDDEGDQGEDSDSEPNPDEPPLDSKTCDLCGKVFRYSSIMRRHRISHRTEKPYKCDVCGKGFNEPGSVELHMYTHGLKTPTCDICGKTFNYITRLQKHKRIHSSRRKRPPRPTFECDTCGKPFKLPQMLVEHQRKFNGNCVPGRLAPIVVYVTESESD